jgi:aminoglycoside 3-N-acetyltransferase
LKKRLEDEMSDTNAIAQAEYPRTTQSLAEQLHGCGLRPGQTVLVHMAMSRLGWVIGGAEAVVRAFLAVLGPEGTLMMPTHTTNNTDPAEWQHPPIPQDWWQLVRDHTPAFNPATTPTREMGAVPELFRSWPGAMRSSHPVTSFAALGPNAEYLTRDHVLEEDTGVRSPVGRLYELDGHVLLLGVTHWNNTSLHLAEARANYRGKRNIRSASAMMVDGARQWVEYETLQTYSDDFGEIGQAFDAAHQVEVNQIAKAEVRFFKQRALVDFAAAWMEQHRDLSA